MEPHAVVLGVGPGPLRGHPTERARSPAAPPSSPPCVSAWLFRPLEICFSSYDLGSMAGKSFVVFLFLPPLKRYLWVVKWVFFSAQCDRFYLAWLGICQKIKTRPLSPSRACVVLLGAGKVLADGLCGDAERRTAGEGLWVLPGSSVPGMCV